MYWVIDILVVLLLVIAVVRGLKKGFFSTAYDFLGSVVMFALALGLTAVFVLIFYKLGAVDQIKVAFIGLIGETNSLFEKIGVTSETIAYYMALGVISLFWFIISYVLMMWLHKGIVNSVSDCRDNKVFCVIDSTVGVIVNTALVACFIFVVFAFFHAFNKTDVFVSADEALRACPISSVLYEHNPFNSLIESIGMQNAFAG